MSCSTGELFRLPEPGPARPAAARRGGLRLACLLALAACTPLPIGAHGDLDLQIAALSRRIKQSPGDATLYLQRAELHRLHGEPDAALADVAEARRHDPPLAEADFTEGRALMDLERWAEARAALDRFLAAKPDHPVALWHRAQALVKLEQRQLAETDFKHCLEVASAPSPELYLARALNLERGGELESSLATLEDGLQRLGSIRSLQLAAVELEMALGRHLSAVNRLDELIAKSARAAGLLVKKAEVLAAAGDKTTARETYLAARQSISQLSPTTQKTQINRALLEKIESALGPTNQ